MAASSAFLIITLDGVSYYLCWDTPHAKGVTPMHSSDVAGAVASGIPSARIRVTADFQAIYYDFANAGEQV